VNLVSAFRSDVGNLKRGASVHDAASDSFSLPQRPRAQGAGQLFLEVLHGPQAKLVSNVVVFVNQATFGCGQLAGSGDDGVEYRVEVERRVDGAANLRQRLELFGQLAQLVALGLRLHQ
jgi:hypothetical protein